MSLWRWRPTTSLAGTLENSFMSSVVKVSYALNKATPVSSPIHCLLLRGLISSTEVSGEAVLAASVPGVDGVATMTGPPFSVTCTFLAPRLDKGSFFLVLIRVYILWLNLVVIPTRGKHLLKKKKKGMRRKGMMSLIVTLFLLNVKVAQDEGRGFLTAVEGKSPRVH